jgi:hypothetical protein
MFETATPRRMSRTFRCALFGIGMTVLARIGPWSWPGWPATTVLDFLLAHAAPSVASPVQKAFGVVLLLFVNVAFWANVARGAWWALEHRTRARAQA